MVNILVYLPVGEYTEPGKCQVDQSFLSVSDQKTNKQTRVYKSSF